MSLSSQTKKSTKDFWRKHIEAADQYDGTIKEYCEQNGLKFGSMSSYRSKLGLSKKRARPKFTPIKINTTPKTKSSSLPDPKWLAQFLKAWSQC